MRLCSNCKTLNRSSFVYCEGCGHSLGCQICRQCGQSNSMTAQFCSACSSRRLTTPAFFLPLTWLVRLVLLAVVCGLVFWIRPMTEPLWDSIWQQVKYWVKIIMMAWVLVTVIWLFILSLLPEKTAKVFRSFSKQSILLVASLLKIGVRAILWIVGIGSRNPR